MRIEALTPIAGRKPLIFVVSILPVMLWFLHPANAQRPPNLQKKPETTERSQTVVIAGFVVWEFAKSRIDRKLKEEMGPVMLARSSPRGFGRWTTRP
jgi:hypothetical protein